jgi:hypothetical protein
MDAIGVGEAQRRKASSGNPEFDFLTRPSTSFTRWTASSRNGIRTATVLAVAAELALADWAYSAVATEPCEDVGHRRFGIIPSCLALVRLSAAGLE